jgi:hypothetical protein
VRAAISRCNGLSLGGGCVIIARHISSAGKMKRLHCSFIALATIVLAGSACMSATSTDSGWITLLDGGRGFDENWQKIGAANWRVVNGVAQADTGEKGKASFLMTKNSYGDFMLRTEFWVSDDANSGIYMRCPDLANVTDRT